MDESNWANLNPKNTILFLGSGFSMEATNKTNSNFMDGKSLSKHLLEVFGDEDTELPSLRDISDDFIPDRQDLLNKTLQPLMTTTKITADQAEIIKHPWRRVYTTNYDDVFEFGMLEANLTPNPVSFNAPVTKIKKGVQIVHLHGYIHDCDDKNIDENLILTEGSYVRQLSKPRPWFDEFIDDARFSQNIVFVGYRLADTPITALLLSDPNIQNKTTFVVRGEQTGRNRRTLSKYGQIRPIALTGFAEHLRSSALKLNSASTPAKFSAFVEMNAKKDKKPLIPATAVEVRNLLTFGRFNHLACAESWPKATYLVPRKKLVNEAINSLGSSKTILIHSRSSNGKSLFSEMFSIALSQKGWRCIRSKSRPNLSDDDLKLLKSTQRLVLFFRSIDDATYTMKQLGTPRPDMRFVVEVSTSIADVRANELGHQLTRPFTRINVNDFDQQDRADFERILDEAGIRPRDFSETFGRCSELRDFLLCLYDNEEVAEKIIEHARPLWELPPVRRAMITVFALKALELEVSPTLKREIIGEDPLAIIGAVPDPLRPHVFDFLDFQDSSVEPFSMIISQFLLAKFLAPQDILDWALNVATIAARRKHEQLLHDQRGPRFHEAVKVLGRILQVSRLRELISGESDSNRMIEDMFEKARRVPEINEEPLFWLQFSFASDDEHTTLTRHHQSLEYLETAYNRASNRKGFKTYQLDTHHLRLLLRIETHEDAVGATFQHWFEINRLLNRFAEMLNEESHRGHVVRVLELLETFISRRVSDMDSSKRRELGTRLESIAKALDLFDETAKHRYSTDAVHKSILRAHHRLRTFTGNN